MSKKFIDQITVGSEFEFADIIKRDSEGNLTPVPEHLGKWEFCENCIINMTGEYRGIACDPEGYNPPVGGEINVNPTVGWEAGVERFYELLDLFPEASSNMLGFNHIHFHSELLSDPAVLRNVGEWIEENEKKLVDLTCTFDMEAFDVVEVTESIFGNEETVTTYDYLGKCIDGNAIKRELLDGARLHADWCIEGMKNANTVEDFIKAHRGKSGKGMPVRYAINTYALAKIGTIEFRNFRASTDRQIIRQQFEFGFHCFAAMLGLTDDTVETIFERISSQPDFKPFPRMTFDPELWNSYRETKKNGHFLDGKNRELLDAN